MKAGVDITISAVGMDVAGNGELMICGAGVGCEAQDEMNNANTLKSVMQRLKYVGIAPDYKPHP
jgi:hypothetical protein